MKMAAVMMALRKGMGKEWVWEGSEEERRGGRYQQAPNLLVSAVSSPHYQQFNKASPNTMPKV